MAFNAYGSKQTAGSSAVSEIDWNALNEYVVETCDIADKPATIAGYVAAIVDLGTQPLPDAEYVFEGTEEEEEEIIEANPNTYFKDGINPDTKKPCRLKCFPQKDAQCVAVAVDFPDIMLNKGQFFGDANAEEKPLRLWLGGQFYKEGVGFTIARPTPLKVTNLDKTRATKKWSFAKNHLFYKMAVAGGVIKKDECFLPERIDELLGKSFLFEIQVFFKEGVGKNKGKKYYTENIKFTGALVRGMKEPEKVTTPFIIQFDENNDLKSVKELNSRVVNTIKIASNFKGSAIEEQLAKAWQSSGSEGSSEQEDTVKEEAPVVKKEVKKKVPPKVQEDTSEDDDLESDLPF